MGKKRATATLIKPKQVYRYLVYLNGQEWDVLGESHTISGVIDGVRRSLNVWLQGEMSAYFNLFDCFVRVPVGLKDNSAPQSE